VRTGQLDIGALRDLERHGHGDSGVDGATGLAGVEPVSMRSVLYPTAQGRVLVFTGEVKNTGAEPVSNLDVVAEVRGSDGTVLGTARAPLGAVMSVAELAHLDTPDAAGRVLASKPIQSIGPGERQPYMVVVSPAPFELRRGRHLLRVVQGTPPVPVSAPAPPEPAPPAVDTMRRPAVTAPEVDEAGDTSKAKLKNKRPKMKRKARDGDEGSEPAEQ
jgi:hypothetical protein